MQICTASHLSTYGNVGVDAGTGCTGVEMTTREPAWTDIQYFLAVAKGGSASRAAEMLGVDQTTVGRRIKVLEAGLDVVLFERLAGSKLNLTDAGQVILAEAEVMSGAYETLLRRVLAAGHGLKGDVRIASSDGVVSYWLLASIAGFQQLYPGLTLSWVSETGEQEIGRSADLGLSWERPRAPHLIARKLGAVRALLYAMPAYVERHGLPGFVEELAQHRVVHFAAYERQTAFAAWNELMVRYPPAMRLATSFSSERAMREGQYIALLPSYTPIIEPTIMVAPLDLGIRVELWLSYHEDQRQQAKVKLVAAEIQRLARQARGTWFLS